MVARAGLSVQATPFLSEVRQRIFICLLAAFLALVDLNVMPYAAPSAAHGNYSTVVGVGGIRTTLACEGSGPATVVLIAPSGLSTVINWAVQEQIARSARLCTVTIAEAVSRSTSNLVRMLPATLYSVRAPAPYVIVINAQQFAVPAEPTGVIPFGHLVAGWVLVHPMPAPATGAVIRSDGAISPLPVGDEKQTALGILSLFWPPDVTEPALSVERRALHPSSPRWP